MVFLRSLVYTSGCGQPLTIIFIVKHFQVQSDQSFIYEQLTDNVWYLYFMNDSKGFIDYQNCNKSFFCRSTNRLSVRDPDFSLLNKYRLLHR